MAYSTCTDCTTRADADWDRRNRREYAATIVGIALALFGAANLIWIAAHHIVVTLH